MKLPDGNQLLHQVEFSGRLFTNKWQENFTLVSKLIPKTVCSPFPKTPLVSVFVSARFPLPRLYWHTGNENVFSPLDFEPASAHGPFRQLGDMAHGDIHRLGDRGRVGETKFNLTPKNRERIGRFVIHANHPRRIRLEGPFRRHLLMPGVMLLGEDRDKLLHS